MEIQTERKMAPSRLKVELVVWIPGREGVKDSSWNSASVTRKMVMTFIKSEKINNFLSKT